MTATSERRKNRRSQVFKVLIAVLVPGGWAGVIIYELYKKFRQHRQRRANKDQQPPPEQNDTSEIK